VTLGKSVVSGIRFTLYMHSSSIYRKHQSYYISWDRRDECEQSCSAYGSDIKIDSFYIVGLREDILGGGFGG
jgi:hypothetical protein